jgi:hypothetical protein
MGKCHLRLKEVYLCSNGENHSEVCHLPIELLPEIEHLMCFKGFVFKFEAKLNDNAFFH